MGHDLSAHISKCDDPEGQGMAHDLFNLTDFRIQNGCLKINQYLSPTTAVAWPQPQMESIRVWREDAADFATNTQNMAATFYYNKYVRVIIIIQMYFVSQNINKFMMIP